MIDLGIGHVDNSVLPIAELKDAALSFFKNLDQSSLQYGPEQGSRSLRHELARFLTEKLANEVGPETLLVSAGASHGLDLTINKLGPAGATIFVEDPTYFYALDVIRDRSLKVVPIPVDQHGLDISALERKLQKIQPSFLYTIPTYHNPTGRTLADESRSRLVELAHEYNFLIIADEVYHLLLADPAATRSLAQLDDKRVVSLGSFSKILGPGLRLGWIQTAPENIRKLLTCGVLRSGGGVNPFMSAIAETALREGFQDVCLSKLRTHYESRCNFVLQQMRKEFLEQVTFTVPDGGYFLWLELPASIDARDLRRRSREVGVDFKPGPLFSWAGNFANCLRMCFTFYDEAQLEFACGQLAALLRGVQD